MKYRNRIFNRSINVDKFYDTCIPFGILKVDANPYIRGINYAGIFGIHNHALINNLPVIKMSIDELNPNARFMVMSRFSSGIITTSKSMIDWNMLC